MMRSIAPAIALSLWATACWYRRAASGEVWPIRDMDSLSVAPAAALRVLARCRKSWKVHSILVAATASSHERRKLRSPGVSASNRNADGSMRAWVVRWLSSSLARCWEMATVRAPASVFGGWRMKPAESVWTSDCSTVTVGGVAERSRCRRVRPRHSPRRSPAKAARSTIARNLGSMASARAKTSSTDGIVRGLDRSTDAPLIWHGFLAINRSSTAPCRICRRSRYAFAAVVVLPMRPVRRSAFQSRIVPAVMAVRGASPSGGRM